MNAHQRQKLLHPVTLRISQIFFDLFRSYQVTTVEQIKEFNPFFIIGSGRSGTTLLRTILQRHPELHIPPESDGRIPNCVKKYYRYGGLEWNDLVFVILGEFSSFETFTLWNIDLMDLKDDLCGLPEDRRTLAHIINAVYEYHMKLNKPGAVRWGDKSPFNTLRLKWIQKVFPNADYIHIIRDGRDVVSSYLKAGLYDTVEEACDRWTRSLQAVEKFSNKQGPDTILHIYYESLVDKTEEVIKEVCDHLNVEYDTALLGMKTVAHADVKKLDHMENVKNPITTQSIGKWKQNLTEEQKRKVSHILRPYLNTYKYID